MKLAEDLVKGDLLDIGTDETGLVVRRKVEDVRLKRRSVWVHVEDIYFPIVLMPAQRVSGVF
ncbi:hypothetical protein [Nonomuraea recticatena]|uniref:Uncharacterized protein n=1 Tax=Nonomuraea recticatena TaxID=46178 RepID=A0ABP6ECP4_9ACTN